jgi:NADH:ubiquinone oxidoreductase subunit E
VALADQIQEVAARYPDRRSAMLPALRMAQERYGWLSPEALAEVADALDYTTAYCLSVASFYDMFHLRPVGQHEVEVCTNLSWGGGGGAGPVPRVGVGPRRRGGVAAP